MNNLTVELNGIKYVLLERIATKETGNKADKIIKKHGGIIQGLHLVKGWFFYKTYIKYTVLIPEQNIIAFNNEKDI